jgi:hypothetical protein
MERAAERDVHDLHTSADRERGHALTIGGEQEVDLQPIAIGFDP